MSGEPGQRELSEGLQTEVIHLLADLRQPREHGQPSARLLLKQRSRTSPQAARNTAKQLLKPWPAVELFARETRATTPSECSMTFEMTFMRDTVQMQGYISSKTDHKMQMFHGPVLQEVMLFVLVRIQKIIGGRLDVAPVQDYETSLHI